MNLRTIMIGGVSGFVGLCLTLAVVSATSGQDEKTNVDAAALEGQLTAMKKARLESAKTALAAARHAFESETVTFDIVVDAIRNLTESEVDAATKVDDEISALNHYAELTKELEEKVKVLYDAGLKGGHSVQYNAVKQEHERAEISLLKAQIKAKK